MIARVHPVRTKHWDLSMRETPRVIAEAVRLAVPRPVPDAARRGTLIALPEESPSAARARGVDALRADPCADWVTIGGPMGRKARTRS